MQSLRFGTATSEPFNQRDLPDALKTKKEWRKNWRITQAVQLVKKVPKVNIPDLSIQPLPDDPFCFQLTKTGERRIDTDQWETAKLADFLYHFKSVKKRLKRVKKRS